MLIESLIRLGRPMVEGGISPRQILHQVSDVAAVNAKSFLANVFVVEIDSSSDGVNIEALPVQEWGEYQLQQPNSKKQVFVQDVNRAVGAPFVIPSGNPLKPQGRYGVPAYLVYDKHFQAFVRETEEVEKFLQGRLNRTIGINLTEAQVAQTAQKLRMVTSETYQGSKMLGLVVLAVLDENSPYRLQDEIPVGDSSLAYMGPSVLYRDKYLVADLELIMERFWEAKLAEGAEMGEKKKGEAACYFCGQEDRVVSSYCKAWRWFTPTWKCPLPVSMKPKELVETIALCPACYGALTYGANLFNKLARPLNYWLTKELFSPSTTAAGKELSRRGNPDSIEGCAFALPVLDSFLEDEEERLGFVDGMSTMLGNKPRKNKLDMHLEEITGFEMFLPQEMDADHYRLTIMYYSGDTGRGDVHLRATIEDVVPSVARQLKKIAGEVKNFAVDLATALHGQISENHMGFLTTRYSSLPYLLTTAYGAPYTWKMLSTVLHRGNISRKLFLTNVSRRMSELSRKLPEGFHELRSEVIFYLAFSEFLKKYFDAVALETGNGGYEWMRDWRDFQRLIAEGPVKDLEFNDPEELGFAAGHLVRIFARQYWHASNGNDFIKHRVMTFGSSLTPEVIWKKALSRMDEYARKLNMKISDDLRQRFAVVLMEYSRLRNETQKERDAFMAAFWAGYALAGSGQKEENNNQD